MRQVKDSPMRRAIKRSMTVLKFARAKQAGTSECQDAPEGLHANKTAPQKTYDVPDLFSNAEVRN